MLVQSLVRMLVKLVIKELGGKQAAVRVLHLK